MGEERKCAQCGARFTPEREHARFCSAPCRMAWNREHAGVAATPAVAIDWSVTAMAESVSRIATASAWDRSQVATALGETVWWITLLDATLVRYHPHAYDSALTSKTVRRHKTERTLAGLRYVRNELGRSTDPVVLVQRGPAGGKADWTWRALPEPDLGGFAPRARRWELDRYLAYRERIAGRDITSAFTRCARFLALAASLATADSVETGSSSWAS
jgi:hypothetical protein